MPSQKHRLPSNKIVSTEVDYLYRLKEIVFELSEIFCSSILEMEGAKPGTDTFLHTWVIKNNIINKTGEIDLKRLENHAHLVVFIFLLQQTTVFRIENHFKNDPSLNLYFRSAFDNLPAYLRQLLKECEIRIQKNFYGKYLNEIAAILQFPSDVIGVFYNRFCQNQHQLNHGQHFTQIDEADILNAFCIKKNTDSLLDPSCGSGIFLIRAFYFFKYFHPDQIPNNCIDGIDISPFSTLLTTVNLLFNENFHRKRIPKIITEDFLKIDREDILLKDSCVGNPPFIRHEMMANKKDWIKLIKVEYGISYINGQSDLYIYFLIHASSFLKEGARLGWVISASWLDVQFGAGLQLFLLDHFKIVAIMDYQAKRSFENASVNTVLLVLEKCDNAADRKNNNVKFVRIYAEYEMLLGEIDSGSRISNAIKFANNIESIKKSFCDDRMQVSILTQEKLKENSTVDKKYFNGHWGAKYLRSPNIYNKIVSNSEGKMFPLSEFVEVKYGVKTGANDFFYLIDETSKTVELSDEEYKIVFGTGKENHRKFWDSHGWYFSALNNAHFIIEKEFIVPVFKTQKEADKLDADIGRLKFFALNCHLSKDELKKKNKKVLEYINLAENEFNIHKRPSVSGRKLWYDLASTFVKGDFIFPSKIGEKYRLIDNRKTLIVCDKVNYVIKIKDQFVQYGDSLFLIMNSIYFRYCIDLFSRQLTGNQTLSDVDVNLLKKIKIPHPGTFGNSIDDICCLFKSLKSREQLPLSKEILQKDKFEIDSKIFAVIGLDGSDVRDLYANASEYVEKRRLKSDSLKHNSSLKQEK
ncbi:MAG: N-6 DNA methylase [Ginsengibacter sp.]